MMTEWRAPLRLQCNSAALVANWRWLAARSGTAACGAAIKANAYGLGAQDVMARLSRAGCRDFYVATWGEARALGPLPSGARVSVLHGVREEDMALALALDARPVLNTLAQVARWRPTGRVCDVMVDTGINRLGLSARDVEAGALAGLKIDTMMSHLACADDAAQDDAMSARQRQDFAALHTKDVAERFSLANSAGICLNDAANNAYAFDLTRPGLALYGGIPRAEARGFIQQVATPQAQILQRRRVIAGDTVGYNATFMARDDTEVAIINLGYADGYLRSFSGPDGHVGGSAQVSCGEPVRLPVLGRVSMDLVALDVTSHQILAEGDWVDIDYNLLRAANIAGLSQYELLTGLGARFERVWS